MSLVSLHKLLHLPVYTKMGVHLGRVCDADVDIEQLQIKSILVQQRGILGSLKNPLIINKEQILEITAERVTVEDAVVSSGAEAELA